MVRRRGPRGGCAASVVLADANAAATAVILAELLVVAPMLGEPAIESKRLLDERSARDFLSFFPVEADAERAVDSTDDGSDAARSGAKSPVVDQPHHHT